MTKNYKFLTAIAAIVLLTYNFGTQADGYRGGQREKTTIISKNQKFPYATAAQRKAIYDKNRQISNGYYTIKERPGKKYNIAKQTDISIKKSMNFIKGGKKLIIDGRLRNKNQFKVAKNLRKYNTVYETINKDSICYGLELQKKGLKPLVLVMANENLPAGASPSGRGNTQEEQISYVSNLGKIASELYHRNVKKRHRFTDIFRARQNNRGYSYLPFRGGIYIPGLAILRNDQSKGYSFTEKFKLIDVYMSAAPRHKNRRLNQKSGKSILVDEDFVPELRDKKIYWEVVKEKIRSMCEAALMNGNDALVLGAFGVGAFANPKDKMIMAFAEVLKEYDGKFKYIGFPVLDSRGKTFNAFRNVFNDKFSPHTFGVRKVSSFAHKNQVTTGKNRALKIIKSINPGGVARLSEQAKAKPRKISKRKRAKAIKQLVRIKDAVMLLKQDKRTISHPKTLRKIMAIEQDLKSNYDFNFVDWNRLGVKKPNWVR